MSLFKDVELGPPIEVFALTRAFNEDSFPNKVSLGAGAYRTEEGKPWVLPVVRKVEQQLAADETLNHEYLPVLGLESFCNGATSLLLGPESPVVVSGQAFGVQTLSGTGALRVGAVFLNRHLNFSTFYYSSPTWENHHLVFVDAGFTEPRTYRYWKEETRSLDIDGFLEDLRNAPENAVIILHACAHNPTGVDPTQDQWKQIADIMQEKKLFPFFDSAYQGFASGDIERDAWAVRYFVSRGFELVCAQSFAKNFGLYNERVGNLTLVLSDASHVAAVKSQLTWIVRGMYSNPPAHGARIVSAALNSPKFYGEWKECIQQMSSRIIEMRKALFDELKTLGTPGTWDHIVNQIGMFSYTGLTEPQVQYIVKEHHIYLLKSGRVNICGLNTKNVKYVAQAIHLAVTGIPK